MFLLTSHVYLKKSFLKKFYFAEKLTPHFLTQPNTNSVLQYKKMASFAPKSSECSLVDGGHPASDAALFLAVPGGTFSVCLCCAATQNTFFCFFQTWLFLKLGRTLSPAQNVQQTLVPSSLADTNSKQWWHVQLRARSLWCFVQILQNRGAIQCKLSVQIGGHP